MINGLNTKKNTNAFGMAMPGRSYQSSNSYRYGFNGKENDKETGTQDYGMRIYNPALGKFLSVDPLTSKYPHYTPYSFAGNKPIAAIDLDGEEESIRFISTNYKGETQIKSIPWSKVVPGEENGSKGTGTLDYTKDAKTGKWSDARYVKSFEDAHPIRSGLLVVESRYQNKEGFNVLGKDLKSKASPVVKGIGLIVSIVAPEFGIPIYKFGGYLEDAGNTMEIISDIDDGKGKDALFDAAAIAASKIVAKGASKVEIKDKVRKFATEAAVDKGSSEVIEAVKDGAKESTPK